MLYILFSILSLSGIFVIFKIAGKKQLSIINIIVVNYLVAAVIGNISSGVNPLTMFSQQWLLMAVLIGVLFFVSFVIIGFSTKLVGLSITTVSAKMSVVVPIIFSVIYFGEDLGIVKIIGIVVAITGVLLSVYKPIGTQKQKINFYEILIPILLFIGMGVSDSLVKYTQHTYLTQSNIALFNSSLFYISFFSSIIYIVVTKQYKQLFNIEIWIFGAVLGLLNYYGILFFINALSLTTFDSSVIFGINNVGIVSFSVLIGLLVFKEKLNLPNKIGIVVSVLSIIILSQA